MLSNADIKAVEQVLSMESLQLAQFLSRLSPGAQGLLENLLLQYEERLR